jgi:catechol 2,3-dioxygenase-like lactoylglutathione lyase family enzyme
MDFKLSHVFIQVHDQDEALKFYRDVLGFKVTSDVVFDGVNRWLTVSPPEQPDVQIMLEKVGMGRPTTDHKALAQLLAKGSLSGPIFRTSDADAAFEKIRASGAEVLQEPINQPYGVRDFSFRDPSGNPLRFSQPLYS